MLLNILTQSSLVDRVGTRMVTLTMNPKDSHFSLTGFSDSVPFSLIS